MPIKKDYWAQHRPDGRWESKRGGTTRASMVADTQADAWSHSRQKAAQTKGEAFLKGRDGKIRERNSYGNDPYPPRG